MPRTETEVREECGGTVPSSADATTHWPGCEEDHPACRGPVPEPPAPGLVRVNRGSNHSYRLDGEPVLGVTTILSAGVPKPKLVPWAARTCAEYAVDTWDGLALMPPSARIKAIKSAPNNDRDRAARRGTEVHSLAARLAAGEDVQVPDELAGHVESYMQFVADWRPVEVLVETPCANRSHRWAGTFDLVADLDDGRRWLLDLKTSRSGVYPESALQLAAYRHAEVVLVDGAEHPMPAVDETGVVWLRPDGYDLVPVAAGPDQYRAFRHAQQVAYWAREVGPGVVGEPLPRPCGDGV